MSQEKSDNVSDLIEQKTLAPEAVQDDKPKTVLEKPQAPQSFTFPVMGDATSGSTSFFNQPFAFDPTQKFHFGPSSEIPKETEVPRRLVAPKKLSEAYDYRKVKDERDLRIHFDVCKEYCMEEILSGKPGKPLPELGDKWHKYSQENSDRARTAARKASATFLYDWGNCSTYAPNSELDEFEQKEFNSYYAIMNRVTTPQRKKDLMKTVDYIDGQKRWRERKPSSSVSSESTAAKKGKKEPKKKEDDKKKEKSTPNPPKKANPPPPVPPSGPPGKPSGSPPAGPSGIGSVPSGAKVPPVPNKTLPLVVPPQDKPKPQVKEISTISEWAATRLRPPVCLNDVDALAYAKTQGIEVAPVKTTMNPHSISAMERYSAMRGFLQMVGRDKKSLDICSYFGSNRDLKFSPPKESGLQINWTCAPDDPIEGDNAREFSCRVQMPDDKLFDAVVFVDVYQSGNSYLDVISPKKIKELIKITTTGYVFGILRTFHGAGGADVFRFQKDDKTAYKSEGAWIEKDGLVYFSPDGTGSSYPGHPNPSWLCKRACDGIDIHAVQTFGPYTLFKFALTAYQAQTIDSGYLLEPKISRSSISKEIYGEVEGNFISKIMTSVRDYCPDFLAAYLPEAVHVKVLVHSDTLASLSAEYAIKKIVGLTLDTVITKVRSSIEQDRVMLVLKTRFPGFVSDLVVTTALAVLYKNKRSTVQRLLVGRQITADVELEVETLRQPTVAQPLGFKTKMAILLFLLGIGALLRRYFQISSPGVPIGEAQKTVNIIGKFAQTVTSCFNPTMTLRSVIESNDDTKVTIYQAPIPSFWEWPMLKSLCTEVPKKVSYISLPRFLAYCLMTPIAEEFLKQWFPKISFFLFAGETLANSWLFGTSSASLIAGMHVLTYMIGKKQIIPAMFIHGLTNFVSLHAAGHYDYSTHNRNHAAAARLVDYLKPVRAVGSLIAFISACLDKKQTITAFQQFKEDYQNKLPIDDKPAVSEIPTDVALLPIESTEYPTQVSRGFMELQMLGVDFSLAQVKEILSDVGLPSTTHKIYPLLINNGIMYTPANSMNNLLACLVYRIHKDPFTGCPSLGERKRNWKRLMHTSLLNQFYQYFLALDSHEDVRYPSMKEIVEIMGVKGKRIEVCNRRLMEGEDMPDSKSYNVKWDETVPLKEVSPGVYDIKPRAICNLDPSIITLTTQVARYLTMVCHLIFDGTNDFQTPFGSLKIVFASGFNQLELTKMHAIMLESKNFLAVAGDDSIFKITEPTWVDYGESDFSMFDQSQDEGPNSIAFAIWMKKLGFPLTLIDSLIWIFAKGYKVAPRNARQLRIVGSGGLQLPTGHTFTTVLNSLNDIFCYMSAFQQTKFDFPTTASSLGFTAKVRTYGADYRPLTFLKGWWMKTDIGHVWMPLPSAVLKIGKFMKPLKYFSDQNPIGICSTMIVNSYFGIDRKYPILGDFLAVLDKFKSGIGNLQEGAVNENIFKPRLSIDSYTLDVEYAVEMIYDRYELEDIDLLEIKDLYSKIQTLPCYVQHSVFNKLRFDYI